MSAEPEGRWVEPSFLGTFARGARRQCPRCGSGDLFTSHFTIREECPRCDLHFERESGYWLGAMTINLVVTQLLFFGIFIGTMLASWPDVPWTPILITGAVLNITVPILFYPWSKTLWLALDHAFFPERGDPAVPRASKI